MKVSVITVNLNNAAGLRKTLQSSKDQTYQDFEQIVIDGGSTDGSIGVMEDFKNFIEYSVSEKDNGIYEAMNKGIRAAKGEYLIFMNSGDIFFDRNTIAGVMTKNYNTDYIFGGMILDCGKRQFHRSIPQKLTFYYLYTHTLYHQSMYVRKSVFERFGFYDQSVRITADWRQYLLAIFKYDCTYTLLPDILSIYDNNGLSSLKMGTMQTILKERADAFNTWFPGFVDDYAELHAFKRVTIQGITKGIKRRFYDYRAKI